MRFSISSPMKPALKFLAFLLLITLYSCYHKESNYDYSPKQDMAAKAQNEQSESEPSSGGSEGNGESTPAKPVTVERKIIKQGEISFETSDADATRATITKTATDLKAYIADDNTSNYGDRTEYRITIRVPSDKFETLLDSISKSAQKLESKNINALDVTSEYIDVEARLKTKKELETRYKELLKQANKVEEILNIEREIGTLRSDIESIEGRLKYLTDHVAYSTLTVVFYQKPNTDFGFGSKIGQALGNGWTYLLWFLLGLVNMWPFLLIAVTIIVIIKRIRKKRKEK